MEVGARRPTRLSDIADDIALCDAGARFTSGANPERWAYSVENPPLCCSWITLP